MAAVGGSLLAAPQAEAAGPYYIDAQITAPANAPGAPYAPPPGGNFNYSPSSFRWNEQFEVSFTHVTDATSVSLMALSQGKKDVTTAVVHERFNGPSGTAVVTLQMSGVHVSVVHEEGSVNNPNGPEETVVLRCKSVTYTYQGINASGVALGPSYSITYSRPGFDANGL